MGQTLAWYADHPEAFAALEDEWMDAQYRAYEEEQERMHEQALDIQFRVETYHYMPGHELDKNPISQRWDNFSVPLGWGVL